MADVLTAVSSSNVPRFTISLPDESSSMNGGGVETKIHRVDGDGDEKNVTSLDISSTSSGKNNTTSSPRYEAFVMTGEKILRLNPKISPSYAQLKQSELPKHTQVCESAPIRGPFADLENNFHYHNPNNAKKRRVQNGIDAAETEEHFACKVSASVSENVLTQHEENDEDVSKNDQNVFNFDKNASLITVQGTYNGTVDVSSIDINAQTLRLCDDFGSGLVDFPSPESPVFVSEPTTPAKFAFGKTRCSVNEKKKNIACITKSLDNFEKIVAEPLVPTSIVVLQKTSENCCTVTTNDVDRRPSDTTISSSVVSISPSLSSSVASTPLKEKLRQLDSNPPPTQQPLNENDAEAAKRLAKRLYNLDGFKKSDVAKQLAKNNEFGNMVAVEYLKLFDCAGLKLDEAIRKLLSNFCLTGETSERERILWVFSRRYHECNPNLFSAEDEVHTLTCALLLLNTDLHGQNVTKRMTCNDFIDNISQTGFKYSKTLLKTLYYSIKQTPIEWAKDTSGHSSKKYSSSSLRGVDLPDPESQVVYKKGWVMRKCVIESDGKNTPFGRRSWRMFYATLKGMVLFLHQDENGFKKGSFLTFRNSIRIHHAFARKAIDYTKKQNVFRLQTATLAEYLFQTSNPNDLDEWMDVINFVAARFSTPSLPSSVSSRDSSSTPSILSYFYRRPSLPASRTKYSLKEQLKSHESRVDDLQKQLLNIRKTLPSRNAKSKILQSYAENEITLLLELERYSTYARLLQNRLNIRRDTTITNSSSAPLSLGELIETSNEDLRNNNNHHNRNDFSSESEIVHNNQQQQNQQQTSGQSDRNSYKAAISGCTTSPKDVFETNF